MYEFKSDGMKPGIVLIVAGLGLLVAALAGLAHSWEWLASICAGFGGGCRETAHYTLIHIPLWMWGVIFYIFLIAAMAFFRPWVTWLVASAFGIELGLLWIMFSMKAVCVFCLANFFIVVLLAVLAYERRMLWQILSAVLLAMMLCIFWVPRENGSVASATVTQSPNIVAKVDGREITLQELEGPLSSRIYNMELEIYNLKRTSLDQMIADMLLRKEAERRGVNLQQLLNEIAAAQSSDVSDAEIEGYYEQNRSRLANWKGTQQQLRNEIRASLERQKKFQSIMDYAKSLRDKGDVKVFLKEPPLPHAQVAVGDSPTQGPPDAAITIVEFSDYRCPSCRKQYSIDEEIKRSFGDKIRWVFKAFPLGGNELSRRVAQAARCAGEQGKFWEYHDSLFSSENDLSPEQLTALAARLGLRVPDFEQCLETEKYGAQIDAEQEDGRKIGIDRTPTLIINGQLHPGGISAEDFRVLLERELEKSQK